MNKITDRNKEQCIDVLNDVFDNFNFDRVHRVMDALEWEWATIGDVPTVEQIKEEASRLMWDCANIDVDCMASGGFRVEKDFTCDPWMRLSFEVEDWDASASELEDDSEDDEQ